MATLYTRVSYPPRLNTSQVEGPTTARPRCSRAVAVAPTSCRARCCCHEPPLRWRWCRLAGKKEGADGLLSRWVSSLRRCPVVRCSAGEWRGPRLCSSLSGRWQRPEGPSLVQWGFDNQDMRQNQNKPAYASGMVRQTTADEVMYTAMIAMRLTLAAACFWPKGRQAKPSRDGLRHSDMPPLPGLARHAE